MKDIRTFGTLPVAVTSMAPEGASKGDLVLIPMSWGGAWAFKLYMKFFAEHGWACHAVDLRGHGRSGGSVEGATMEDYVDDVRTAVSGLGIEKPVIIGHSMGGLVALMYGAMHPTGGVAALDASPSLEVQKTSEEKTYPLVYRPKDAGMPGNPMEAMKALPDLPLPRMMIMKMMLGVESGVARSERKRGVSVPKETLAGVPLLFVGAENGTSLPFGIGIEKARAQARFYGGAIVEVKGSSHPGLLIGRHWQDAAQAILDWLSGL